MPLPYTHIFWDLDHTLWDFESNSLAALHLLYEQCALAQKGVPAFENFSQVYHEYNDKYWDRFRKGFITRELMRWKRMNSTLLHYGIGNEALAKEMGEVYLHHLAEQSILEQGAMDALHFFAQHNCHQHIITNGFEKTQLQKMKNSGITHFFEKIITSEKAMCLKPHKEIYEYALQQTNATLKESLMIGDAVDVDVLGALQVEMHAVWYNPKKMSSSIPATYTISSLAELSSLF